MVKKRATQVMCMLFAVLMAICLTVTLPKAALADDSSSSSGEEGTYYLSYKKYVAAENADGSKTITYTMVTEQIENLLKEGMRRYESGVAKDGDDGYYKPFTNSYGFWYETSGFEKTVMGYISGARVTEVELLFSNMKKAVNAGESVENVQKCVDDLLSALYTDAAILDDLFGYSNSSSSSSTGLAWATFAAILSIFVREGLEAILIVGALAAYAAKTENKRGSISIYVGTGLAIIASFLTALVFYIVSKVVGSSLSQEIVEGVTALIAVAVLVYVSNWMTSKSEAAAWTGFIKDKASESANGGKMFALGGTAFLAVYREGAEIVLFCQQYFNRAGEMENGYLAIAGGIVGGFAIVAIVFVLIRVFGVKLPISKFFMAVSFLMAIMSVAFIGSGMFELFVDGGLAGQIGGWVQSLATTIPALSWMSSSTVLDFLGVHPTWITLGPQILMAAFWVFSYIYTFRKNKKKHAEEAEKKAA